MARPKPWLKMWTEWVHDPKMLGLTLAEQAAWWRVVSLAQVCNAGGPLVKGNGAPLTIEEMAETLHLEDPKNLRALKSMIKKLEDEDSLAWNHGTLTVIHLNERQELASSETPEARRDRVRRYREKQRLAAFLLHEKEPGSASPLPSPNKRERERESVTARNSLHGNGKPVTLEPALAEITKLYEKHFGIITPILAEKWKSFVENYHGPVEWIALAFDEAVKYKNRRWQYVEAILYSWQEKGGPHGDRREPGAERERPGAHQRDPISSYREQGWEVIGDDEPETTQAGNPD